MLYELRFYRVAPGRTDDNHARHRDRLPPLFARHGIHVVGRWTAMAGPDAPLFAYVIAYPDLAERERQWADFYGDAEWWEIRAETNAGSEMVEGYDLMLLRSHAELSPAPATPGARRGGVHELTFFQVSAGQGAPANQFLASSLIPAIERHGGEVMMVADLLTGARLPRITLLTAWTDAQAHLDGRAAVECDPQVCAAQEAERAASGRTSLGRRDVYLLDPAPYALPLAAMGLEA